MPRRVYTENQITAARQLRRLGFTLDEISRATGLSNWMTYYHCMRVDPDKDGHRKLARGIADMITIGDPRFLINFIQEGTGQKIADPKGELTITLLRSQAEERC